LNPVHELHHHIHFLIEKFSSLFWKFYNAINAVISIRSFNIVSYSPFIDIVATDVFIKILPGLDGRGSPIVRIGKTVLFSEPAILIRKVLF